MVYMSKHSKWAKVKHQKGAVDAKRANVFTKLAREITVAAREGGDPVFNFKLRSAIDRALAENVPKDNIERAIKKGTGEIASDRIEEVIYEGYAPGGLPVLVEALTDNRNRTAPNIRHVFSKHGGNMGASGSVQWMFERFGVVWLAAGQLTEVQELALIEAGASDIIEEDDGLSVRTQPEAVARVRDAAEAAGLRVDDAGFEWVAKEKATSVAADALDKATDLLEALEEDEDVSGVYTNL
jgi:YebC/PmpR family DNA-binding regulatory protein